MRVLCRHGHIALYPRRASDVNTFAASFGVEIEREEDYYTFSGLIDAPEYSLKGSPYLDLPATITFQGKPWDVMKENNFLYNIALKKLVPKASIVAITEITQKGLFYVCNTSILQPGVRTRSGDQILSYSGEFYEDKFYLRITEFSDE